MRKLSTEEFAQQVGLSQIRVRELARDGRITYARKEGGRWRFRPSSKIIPALRNLEQDGSPHTVRALLYWTKKLGLR
jgi:excisionase family DNA binding protein